MIIVSFRRGDHSQTRYRRQVVFVAYLGKDVLREMLQRLKCNEYGWRVVLFEILKYSNKMIVAPLECVYVEAHSSENDQQQKSTSSHGSNHYPFNAPLSG